MLTDNVPLGNFRMCSRVIPVTSHFQKRPHPMCMPLRSIRYVRVMSTCPVKACTAVRVVYLCFTMTLSLR